VQALQAAWSSIATTAAGDDPAQHLQRALESAVRGGRDTDTVAAIAGGLIGAAYGATAVPTEWRLALHGWPGMGAVDLEALADSVIRSSGRR
jgi:ADP-ribosylglycohydrolase